MKSNFEGILPCLAKNRLVKILFFEFNFKLINTASEIRRPPKSRVSNLMTLLILRLKTNVEYIISWDWGNVRDPFIVSGPFIV